MIQLCHLWVYIQRTDSREVGLNVYVLVKSVSKVLILRCQNEVVRFQRFMK